MKLTFMVSLWLAIVCCFDAGAADYFRQIEIPSSFNPVGSGARSLGMGGAFIAVADDATAASWNPGGLIQLERPEISIVFDGFHRKEDNSFASRPESSGIQTVSEAGVNYFSAAYPFRLWNRNMIAAVSYQDLYDFTRKWDFSFAAHHERLSSVHDIDYRQDGKLTAVGVSYSVQVLPTISVGLTVNFWKPDITQNQWEEIILQRGGGNVSGEPFESVSRTRETYSFRGVNASIGVLWHISGQITAGAVLKTPFKADLSHEHQFNAQVRYPNQPKFGTESANDYSEDCRLEMPLSYGVGISWLLADKVTLSFDLYRTLWDDFILTDSTGRKTSPITGKLLEESGIDPVFQARMGAEYLIVTPSYLISLCAGVFYDPAPAPENPDDFYGFSFGTGVQIGRVNVNMAYQYRFGKDVRSFMLENMRFSQDVAEHTFHVSTIVYF